jgi:hypothetical protein
MKRMKFFLVALCVVGLDIAVSAEPIPVKHIQRPMHRFMVARTDAGKIIARGEFTQTVRGDEVTMSLLYTFADGSIDDETTTYLQRGKFKLVQNHHIQKGPFFAKPVDFEVDAATGTATSRTTDKNGTIHAERHHVEVPDDLANGFIGTLLLNTPTNATPFRVGMLAPVGGGRLIRVLISPEGEQPFHIGGQTLKASVFRIHPELGAVVSMIASLLGLKPKDVMVWVLEGDDPAVERIVGQLGGGGPVISSELEGNSF